MGFFMWKDGFDIGSGTITIVTPEAISRVLVYEFFTIVGQWCDIVSAVAFFAIGLFTRRAYTYHLFSPGKRPPRLQQGKRAPPLTAQQ